MMASQYPRRRITLTACVLLCLGFALLRLPLDQKSYAKESAKFLRTESNGGRNGKQMQQQQQQPQQQQQLQERPEPSPKGGMVRLSELKPVPVNHDGSGATKQTMILNGQVPHLTGFTRSVFSPGDQVELHRHKSKDEVFYAAEGKGIIEVDGTVVQLTPGTCVHVAAGQLHSLENTGDVDMVLFYFGIAVEPPTEDGEGRGGSGKGKGGGVGGGGWQGGNGGEAKAVQALHAIGV